MNPEKRQEDLMSYLKAEDILPKELIEAIQQYVNGTNIYIPCIDKKDWGSNTCSKEYYELRNREIHSQYMNGMTVANLAKEYSLSEKTIYKILRKSHMDADYEDDQSLAKKYC